MNAHGMLQEQYWVPLPSQAVGLPWAVGPLPVNVNQASLNLAPLMSKNAFEKGLRHSKP